MNDGRVKDADFLQKLLLNTYVVYLSYIVVLMWAKTQRTQVLKPINFWKEKSVISVEKCFFTKPI